MTDILQFLATVTDPIVMGKVLWPDFNLYNKQVDIVRSVQQHKETFVVAGNQLGKDKVAGFLVITWFLNPRVYFPQDYVRQIEQQRSPGNRFPHFRRIVTTSVKDEHLAVLWAEVGWFIQNCRLPLLASQGGPLVLNHHEMRLAWERDVKNPQNYAKGMVSQVNEGAASMQGHHSPYSLFIGDEASGLPDEYWRMAQTWLKKAFVFGNAWPCNNFFRRAVRDGDLRVAS